MAANPTYYTFDANGIDTRGYVNVSWAASFYEPNIVRRNIYRKPVTSGIWEKIGSVSTTTRFFRDYLAESHVEYNYNVTQVSNASGSEEESPIGQALAVAGNFGSEYTDNRSVEVEFISYWIINTENNSKSLRLTQVVGDSWTDEYEEAVVNLIGRGRHKDYGTRFGYSGSLNCQLRGVSARSARLLLEELIRREDGMYLRNPFGDLFPVALGNLQVTFLPGVGNYEMSDVSFDYLEVGE